MDETPENKKKRIRSIYVIHVSMFVFSLGFSINLTGVFPYMKQLLPSTSSDEVLNKYGLVVAMNPLGQMIASPLLGYIFNKTDNLRLLSILMAILYIIGNSMYSLLTLLSDEDARYIGLMAARFVVGFASGISAPLRAYISSSTFFEEKTKHLSIVALFQTMGFIVGPGIQAALTPLQCGQPPPTGPYFTLDMYTVAGWLSVVMGGCMIVLYSPVFFTPFDVTKQEQSLHMKQALEDEKESALIKPDYLAALISLANFFVFQATFVFLETLGTPLCMDQFAWSEETTIFNLGIIMSVGGLMSLVCFLTIAPLSKRFDERYIYYILGLIPMNIGRLFLFSGGSELPPLPQQSDARNASFVGLRASIPFVSNDDCAISSSIATGCIYDWCTYVPAIQLWQFLVSYAILSIAFPFSSTLCSVIFTKILGPRPQGVWMGALSSSGSLARVLGPIIVSYIYKEYGINVTSGLVLGLTLFSLGVSLISHKRMVPLLQNTKVTKEDSNSSTSEQVEITKL